jgi:plasmid maintenance system antidote protein VapI
MFVGHGSPSIVAQSVPAEATMMIATLVALMMLGMFVAIYFAHKRTLDDADIQQVADSLKKQAHSIDEFVTEKYSLSLDDAIQRLDELQKSVAVFIAMVKAVQRPDDHP